MPTAAARTCVTAAEADAALEQFGPPYVVKDDGLTAGKGVLVTMDAEAARAHARSAAKVVIEEFLDGPEVSLFAVCDGSAAVPLIPAQDFKRAGDGDLGPNTGGMGAYTPLPWAPACLTHEVMARSYSRRRTPCAGAEPLYQGLLYAGLSLTAAGVKVVEFNARFGDPETQVVLDRLETPLGGLLYAAATGDLTGLPALRWRPGAAVTVVVAAEGYPARPVTGDIISGLDQSMSVPGAYVLQAGTASGTDGVLRSSGGRVLERGRHGRKYRSRPRRCLRGGRKIQLRGGWWRTDIAAAAARASEENGAGSGAATASGTGGEGACGT